MKKQMMVRIAAAAVVVASLGAWSRADDVDRAGKLGLGAAVFTSGSNTSPGLGLRYWFSDKLGWDIGGYFLTDDGGNYTNRRINGASTELVMLFKKKGGLRLEGLLGPSYDYSNNLSANPTTATETRLQTVTFGAGLGVEYSFQELPDLGLAAAVTGFGASHSIQDVTQTTNDKLTKDVTHDEYWTYASHPEVSLVARYYF